MRVSVDFTGVRHQASGLIRRPKKSFAQRRDSKNVEMNQIEDGSGGAGSPRQQMVSAPQRVFFGGPVEKQMEAYIKE